MAIIFWQMWPRASFYEQSFIRTESYYFIDMLITVAFCATKAKLSSYKRDRVASQV